MRFCPTCRSIYTAHIEFCGIDGSNLQETEGDALVGLEIDRYQVVDRIGVGATGCVYRVKHTMLEQEHAMKVLYGDLSQDARVVERFKREAKAISSMRHQNILSVTDFGRTHDGLTFLVMELVRGVTLEDEIFAGAPFSIDRAARILEQIAAGLGEAHRRGFIHRDVKPSNMMLRPEGGAEHVKILDFGIVGLRTEVDARLTASGFIIGTPAYMAPEQACDPSGVTPAADFYSLGVILFEMLTGRLPFNATQPVDMIVQHSVEPVPPIPPAGGLEKLARWMLEKMPANRPQTADEILLELANVRLELQAEEQTQPALPTKTDELPILDPVEYADLEQRLENIRQTLSEATSMRAEVRRTFDARLAAMVAASRPGRLAYLYRDLEAKIAELERALEVYS